MRKRMGVFIVLFLAALGVTPASAQQTHYTDHATFSANVTNEVVFDFNNSSPGTITSFAGGRVLTTTTGGADAVYISNYGNGFGMAMGGADISGGIDNFSPVKLTFPTFHATPLFAVGFDVLDLMLGSEAAVINVEFSDGTAMRTFEVVDTDSDFTTAVWFGIVSTNPIASIEVYSRDGIFAPRANLIDNISLSIPLDTDEDGVPDHLDNCPTDYNADQSNQDNDNDGDVCDDCPSYPNDGGVPCPGEIGSFDPANAGTAVLIDTTALACVQWKTLPDGQTDAFLPDCSNIRFVLKDGQGVTLEPIALYPTAYDVDDAVVLSPGDTHCVSCDLSERFPDLVSASGASLVSASGVSIVDASYASYVTDIWYKAETDTCEESINGITMPAGETCKKVWVGQIDLFTSDALPSISWATPAPIVSGTELSNDQLNAIATDGGSPVVGSFSYQPGFGEILSPGSHSLKTTFTPDDMELFSIATSTVQLQVNNFAFAMLPPYAPPTEKSFKLKRAIPIKWQYADSSGAVIDSEGATPVVSIKGPYSCSASNTVTEEIEAASTGSSGYQYDPLTHTWQYNWKTNGLSKDSCYDIYIRSDLNQVDGPFPIHLK